MIKEIGKVKLNYRNYAGTDLYSDGAVEDELLEIVKNHEESEFSSIIAQKRNWEILYHLSHYRKNLIDWLPIGKSDSVLEIGAGCGALTGCFADKAGSVTCIELSEKRSMVNAYRNKDRDNIEILLGNFEDVERTLEKKYDFITLIGVLEFASAYISSERPYEDLLKTAKKHLKPAGKLVIAIENKLGMKYWAGCKEDHTGLYFEGIEGYSKTNSVRTFSKHEFEELIRGAGFSEYTFYYPYPDYKLPTAIFSDAYLPGDGELQINVVNFDNDRVVLFDEAKAFASVAREGLFPVFSNSYLVSIRNGDGK